MTTKLNHQIGAANIEILSIPGALDNRHNEDAWMVLETWTTSDFIVAAVIDGAGTRVTIPLLEEKLKENYPGLTPAAFAANCVRTSLTIQLVDRPDLSLRAALLTANEALRTAVASLVGETSSEHLLSLVSMPDSDDLRRVRLILPACVVTLVRLDAANRQLEYAHAGDTSLLEIRYNGDVVCHTSDQMGPYDEAALRLADDLRRARKLPHLIDAVHLPEVRQMNIENGLRHNYVDRQGHTHPDEGCGVINGLPELADYIEYGALSFDPGQTLGYCLLSDGLHLLAPLEETAAETAIRLGRTGKLLKMQGLHGLFKSLQRMIETDLYLDRYPRMKVRDDATGVYLRIMCSDEEF